MPRISFPCAAAVVTALASANGIRNWNLDSSTCASEGQACGYFTPCEGADLFCTVGPHYNSSTGPVIDDDRPHDDSDEKGVCVRVRRPDVMLGAACSKNASYSSSWGYCGEFLYCDDYRSICVPKHGPMLPGDGCSSDMLPCVQNAAIATSNGSVRLPCDQGVCYGLSRLSPCGGADDDPLGDETCLPGLFCKMPANVTQTEYEVSRHRIITEIASTEWVATLSAHILPSAPAQGRASLARQLLTAPSRRAAAAIAWQVMRGSGDSSNMPAPVRGSIGSVVGSISSDMWLDPWGAMSQVSRQAAIAATASAKAALRRAGLADSRGRLPSNAAHRNTTETTVRYPDGIPGQCMPRVDAGDVCGSNSGYMPMVDPCESGSVCWQPDRDPEGTSENSPAEPVCVAVGSIPLGSLVLYYTDQASGEFYSPGFEPFCSTGFAALAFNLTSDRFEMRCAAAPDGSLTGELCGNIQDPHLDRSSPRPYILMTSTAVAERTMLDDGESYAQIQRTGLKQRVGRTSELGEGGGKGRAKFVKRWSRWNPQFAAALPRDRWPLSRKELRNPASYRWYQCVPGDDSYMRWRLPLSVDVALLYTQTTLSQCARSAGGSAVVAGCSMEAYMTPGSCMYYHCFEEHTLARCAAQGMLTTAKKARYFGKEEPACSRRYTYDLSEMNACAFEHPHMAGCAQMPGVGTAAGTCPYVPPQGLSHLQLIGIIVASGCLGMVLIAVTVGQCSYRQAKRGAKAETNRLLIDGAAAEEESRRAGGDYMYHPPDFVGVTSDGRGASPYGASPGQGRGNGRSSGGHRNRGSTEGSSMRESMSEGSYSDSYRGGDSVRDYGHRGGRGRGGIGNAMKTPPREGWAAAVRAGGVGSLQHGNRDRMARSGRYNAGFEQSYVPPRFVVGTGSFADMDGSAAALSVSERSALTGARSALMASSAAEAGLGVGDDVYYADDDE